MLVPRPRLWLPYLASLGLLGAALAVDPPTHDLPRIFNGTDLAGWTVSGAPYWKVADGVIVGESDAAKQGSMLFTEKDWRDAVVEAEVRFTGEIDSGIVLRKPELQVQIGVSRSLKRDMTGSFYVDKAGYPEEARAARGSELVKPGEWNRIRVEAKGDTFTVWLNGEQVSRYVTDKFPDAAPIGLQVHKGVAMKVEFRDVRARQLP
jgi:hypothetical protein